jgi:hypothetical protein
LALVRVDLGPGRPADHIRAKLRSLGAISNKLLMAVWQTKIQVEFFSIRPLKPGPDILVLVDDGPRTRSDRSFLYKLLVQRRGLKLRFPESEILVFLALEGRVEDQMTKYAGWAHFLTAVHQTGFGVFVIRRGNVMYFALPPSTYIVSQDKTKNEWTSRDLLTNSLARMLMNAMGEACNV